MILGMAWLDVRKANFNKTYNTLWICNNGACYQFQVRSFNMGPLLYLSDKIEHDDIIKGARSFPFTCDAFLESMKVQATLDML